MATDLQAKIVAKAALLALFPGLSEQDADQIVLAGFGVSSGGASRAVALDLAENLELAVLAHMSDRLDVAAVHAQLQRANGPLQPPRQPRLEWSRGSGKLWFRGSLIKRFTKPADNQRRVLDAFQRQNWPLEIFNPFWASSSPVVAGGIAKQTAENLNDDHLTPHLLWFGTRQSADYIYWAAAETA